MSIKRIQHSVFLLLLLLQSLYPQVPIPPERLGSWGLTGYSTSQREIPRSFHTILDIKKSFNAHGNGIDNDDSALIAARQRHLETSQGGTRTTVIYFPPGTYRLNSRILISSPSEAGIVFRGSGSTLTTLAFYCDTATGSLFDIQSQHDVAIENLKIVRVGTANDQSRNISFSDSHNCWVVGVESHNPMQYHVYIIGNNCSNIVVKGSYFSEAADYGECWYPSSFPFLYNKHTHGYGICIGGGAHHCLFEDNVFRYLRHGIGISNDAHDNVAIFNYVREGHSLDYPAEGYIGEQVVKNYDIFCHGQGSHRNLIEANVVDILGADDHNSQCGDYNTFFRNRALYDASSFNDPSEYCDEDNDFVNVPNLNIVGNMFLSTANDWFEPEYHGGANRLDILAYYGSGYVGHCCGLIGPLAISTGYLPTYSLYYTSNTIPPACETLPGAPWPLIGPRISTNSTFLPQTNAAQQRWGRSKLTVDAGLAMQYFAGVKFRNVFPGSTAGGTVAVNGTTYQAPTPPIVFPGGATIQANAPTQIHDGVSYSISSWSNDFEPVETFTGATIPVLIARDVEFTAYYVPTPNSPPNVQPQGDVGEQPHLVWQEHPNANVLKYQIWRIIKPYNQNALPATLIAELNRGTTQFTDEEYVVTSTRSNDLVSYDVRSVLVVAETNYFSNPCWYTYFARGGAIPNILDTSDTPFALSELMNETASNISLNVFPTPFNPSTTVLFSLPSQMFVSLTLYDILGRNLMQLYDGIAQAGDHSLHLDASRLSAGPYFLRFVSTSVDGKPTAITRRIVLSK